ncbi:DUF748 domain-containing protein [Shewanella chilikensis]|uniref:DUF748 domain-containing protein n=1 Tax=Shewanella chilikensis TaxID=558541 RepID=UPI001F28801F|nr:DUF748 domain-containing protein [Shewanella chilikensis]MCE9787120.1 DUF748 domain-containing protein [Shewanella chilikensis]
MPNVLTQLFSRFRQAPLAIKTSIYLLLGYSLYALLLGGLAPWVIKSQTPKQLQQLLGRQASLKDISINPFLLRVRLDNFVLQEGDPQQVFVSFTQLELELAFWRSLTQGAIAVDHIYLVEPQVNVQRLASEDGQTQFNFSDMLAHLEANRAPQAEATADATEPPRVIARDIRVTEGKFAYMDKVANTELSYDELNFSLQALDTKAYSLSLPEDENKPLLAKDANRYALSLTGSDNGQLQTQGQFQLQPLEVTGELQLAKISLLPFWPFTDGLIAAKLSDGELSFQSQYQLKLQQEQLHYSTHKGRFILENLLFSDQQQARVKLPLLALDNIRVDGDNQSVDIDELALQGLWADARLDKQGLDLQQLFMPAMPATNAKPGNTAAKAQVEPAVAQPKAATETKAQNKATAKEKVTAKEKATAEDKATAQEKAIAHTAAEPSKALEQDKQWLLSIGKISLKDTDLNLFEQQQSNGVHWRVYPLDITTGPVRSDLEGNIDYQVQLALSSAPQTKPETSQGQFSSTGTVDAQAFSVDGELALTELELQQFQPYLAPYLNMQLESGKLSTQGRFTANAEGKAHFQGQAAIGKLLIKDGLAFEPLLKWQNMAIDAMSFDSEANSLKISNILLDKPYAKVMITEDQRTNIGELIRTEPLADNSAAQSQTKQSQINEAPQQTAAKEKTNAKASADKAFKLDIGSISIQNGSAYFADNSLTPNFASGIERLEGKISQLSSTPGTKASVDIKGKIDKYAPVTLRGEVNPLLEKPYLDLDLVFKSVELTSVNPYSGTYAGYYIDKGQLSLALNYQLEDNQLKGDNHLVIDQLKLGKPSDSDLATSLPITLAIALLQDRHGVIDLGLQVSGDLDSPSFSFGSIVMTAITNVITKAVTAPFSLLAGLVGSDEELNLIAFQPGIATLDADAEDKLSKLAKALDDRPMLQLSIEGSVALREDSEALAEQKLQQQLLKASKLAALPDELSASRFPTQGKLADALVELFEQQLKLDADAEKDKVKQRLAEKADSERVDADTLLTVWHMGLYNQLLSAQEISNNELANLAQARAQAIKAFLVDSAAVAPERVFLLDSKTEMKKDASQAILSLNAE